MASVVRTVGHPTKHPGICFFSQFKVTMGDIIKTVTSHLPPHTFSFFSLVSLVQFEILVQYQENYIPQDYLYHVEGLLPTPFGDFTWVNESTLSYLHKFQF